GGARARSDALPRCGNHCWIHCARDYRHNNRRALAKCSFRHDFGDHCSLRPKDESFRLTRQPIHIALTFDDNFWAPAYATMRSVCLFTRRRSDLVFHLCHRTLTAEHWADLEAITAEFPVELRWYDLDASDLFRDVAKRMPENKRLSNIVYARLMIDRLVGPDVERVLYLDCDMLVRDNIEKLFDIDMEGKPIAAVRDSIGA